jgi:amidase
VKNQRDLVKDTVIWNAEAGEKLTGPQLSRAERMRTELYHRLRQFMEAHEFLILPVSQVPPFDVKQPYITEINGVKMQTYIDWMKSCYYITVTGLPAISVPCGFTQTGLPIGLQLAAGRWREGLLLRVARAYENATPWHERQPLS